MAKKILIVYAKGRTEIFNRQSALGSYIHCLATILSGNGYEVTINEALFSAEPVKNGNIQLSGGGRFPSKFFPSFLKEAVKDFLLFRQVKRLYEIIDNGKSYDRVLEFYTYGSDIGYKISKKLNIPLVLIYDNPILEEHSFFHRNQLFFKRKIERRESKAILAGRSIVVYSNAVKEYLNKKYNKKLPAFIHQNVDYTRFDFIEMKSSEPTINIGFIGSFLRWHRVDLLLVAFNRLKKEGKNIRLFLLGNGLEFNSIFRQVADSDFREDIVMSGFVDGETLLDFKKRIHIGVMPGSNWYGAPNKIFEYGAAKMAVVAPDTPTIKDLFIDSKEVLLFKQDDEDDLYQKLKNYLNDALILERHSIALQEKIRNNYSKNITFVFYNELLK